MACVPLGFNRFKESTVNGRKDSGAPKAAKILIHAGVFRKMRQIKLVIDISFVFRS